MRFGIILLFVLVYVYGIANDCKLSFKSNCFDSSIKSVQLYDEHFKLLVSTDQKTDTLIIKYEVSNPKILYIGLNDNLRQRNIYNTIIVNSDSISFEIVNCEVTNLFFINSEINTLNQSLIRKIQNINENNQIPKKYIPLLRDTSLNIDSIENLKLQYRIEMDHFNDSIILLENEFYTSYPQSFLPLYFLNESLKFRRRNSIADYYKIINSIDTNKLKDFQILNEIVRVYNLKPLLEGDVIDSSIILEKINGNKIRFDSLLRDNETRFVYFWTNNCPHIPPLQKKINALIDSNKLNKNQIVSINFDLDLPDSLKMEIQSSIKYFCFFYEPKLNNDLIDKLWVNSVPFGIILRGKTIISKKCKLYNYLKLIHVDE